MSDINRLKFEVALAREEAVQCDKTVIDLKGRLRMAEEMACAAWNHTKELADQLEQLQELTKP